MTSTERLSVVVLTSIPLGIEVAAALRALAEVGRLSILTAPTAPHRSTAALIRVALRYEGIPGLLRAGLRRARKAAHPEDHRTLAAHAARHCPNVAHFAVDGFHSETCRARIKAMAPDLGVVVGTPILRSDLTHTEVAQDAARARTHRRATCALKRELRRRVAERRRAHQPCPAGRLTYGAAKP